MKPGCALVFVLALALVIGCEKPARPLESGTPLVHENGLHLLAPTGFETTRTERGFSLLEGRNLRYPLQIQIERVATPPELEMKRERAFASGESARFAIEALGAHGSGEPEFELHAVRRVGGDWLVLSAHAQVSPPYFEPDSWEPDFALAWSIFATGRHQAIAVRPVPQTCLRRTDQMKPSYQKCMIDTTSVSATQAWLSELLSSTAPPYAKAKTSSVASATALP